MFILFISVLWQELLLLGCISSKWTSLIARLMSISYDSLTISTIYNEVRNLILRKYHNIQFQEEMMNSKVVLYF